MGWLRDLMFSAKPPVRSFGALARAVLGVGDWAAASKIQPRSLASILSKLDRDQELEWLADRADVQASLAKVLGCSPADLRRTSPAQRPTGTRLVRLESLRYGRTLDLEDEVLPPGIPDEVRDPDRWERLWWVAPSGAGRSLAARWLEARGLARVGDTRSRVPSFIEQADGTLIEPVSPRVLVASPVPPSERDAWRVIASPSVDSFLPALVRWAIERLPPDTALEEEATLRWLREGPLARGELHTLGGVLGWCGALDELGLDRVRGKTSLEVAQRFLTRRLREALGEDHADFSWMRKHVLELLIGLARRALTDDTAPFSTPRNLDGWLALIPEPYRAGFDVEWMRVSLARVDSSIRPTDIERAARLLSPGAFRVLRVLRTAELLVGTDEAITASPHWLAELVSSEAERRVLDGSPFEWGEALLRPHAAPRIAHHLFTRALALDMTATAKLAESDGEDSPAHALAVETCFRVSGLAELLDREQDPELLDAVWEEQSELWLRVDGVPTSRVEHPEAPTTTLLMRGAWYAAALALGESLDEDISAWRTTAVYQAIHEAALRADALGEEWGTRVAPLLDRLRAETPVHLLELPGFVLDRIARGELEWSYVAEVPSTERGRFVATLRARKLELDVVARALFEAWERGEAPPLTNTLLEPGENPLFSAVPAELVGRVLEVAERDGTTIDARDWNAERLAALAKVLTEVSLGTERATAILASVSEPRLRDVLGQCLDADIPSERLGAFWRASPDVSAQALTERITAGDWTAALALSRAAPDGHVNRVVAVWRGSGVSRYELGELTSLLHQSIGRRVPGWRDAYTLLGEIERGRLTA